MLKTLKQHQSLPKWTLGYSSNKLMSKNGPCNLKDKNQRLIEVILLICPVLIFDAIGELGIVEVKCYALNQKVNLKEDY